VAVDPGQSAETSFVADKLGTYWYYCTWFCSALHLEMRGRMLLKPAGAELNDSLGPLTREVKLQSTTKANSSSFE
jgi:heme/copper-type cytochrome/quinol oxidase subunit 2